MAIAPATNSVAYHSAMRSPNARVKRGRPPFSISGSEDIAHAANRVQQLVLERPIDLLAKAAHEHVDDVGLWIEVVLPHVRQDHRLRHDAPGIAHQVLEEREFARPKLDRLAGARDAARQQIEHEI